MFEKELEDKFKKIFGIKKVSYDEPGENGEQDCLFIQVENVRSNPKDGRIVARITGNAALIGPNDKLPFGFFSKCIGNAEREDLADLFFSDFETNTRRYRNLVQRGFSFVYFFDSQYDPETGSITGVTITVDEE